MPIATLFLAVLLLQDAGTDSGRQAIPQASGSQQASGPAIAAMFYQVYPNWTPTCDAAGLAGHRIAFDVTLDREGRIVEGPTLVRPQDDPAWRAAAETAREALLRSAPFDVPAGFTGGRYRPTFRTDRACAGRAQEPDEG